MHLLRSCTLLIFRHKYEVVFNMFLALGTIDLFFGVGV